MKQKPDVRIEAGVPESSVEVVSTKAAGPSLKSRALRYLTMREHSRAELETKLAPHAQSRQELAQALDELAAKGLQSDARTSQAVARSGAARYGNARITAKLREKGVAPELIHEALAELEEDELARATAVWQRKFGEFATDPKEKARQMRFLMGRGFSQATIYRVMRDAQER